MLSRKVEGLDPVRPWQPFIRKEGATFYLCYVPIAIGIISVTFRFNLKVKKDR